MARACTQCHAELDEGTKADWCPACGGALTDRPDIPHSGVPAAEIDHRGIVLPRRFASGGIITPR